MEILPSDERLQASEPFQPSLIKHCQGHRKGPSKLPSPVTGGARHPLPPERGQEQSPQAPHPPWTGMSAPSEGPGTAPAPSPRQLAARRFTPGSPPARWQMDRRPPGVRAGKRHQHQNQRDVGWSRRCSDCGGRTQLGHNVSPAPLSLSAQGSQQGAWSLKWGSLRHPKSSVGMPGGVEMLQPGKSWYTLLLLPSDRAGTTVAQLTQEHPCPWQVPVPSPPHSRSSPSTTTSPSCSQTASVLPLRATPSIASALSFHLCCKPD